MTTLVIAEHENATLRPATLNAVTAAAAFGGDVHILVAGSNCDGAAQGASQVPGVAKVLVADSPAFGESLAENVAAQILAIASGYEQIIATATAFGKNVMPRVAAKLDVQQLSDVQGIQAPDVFVRPTYAGNVIATFKSSDKIKVVTVRGTAFFARPEEAAAAATDYLRLFALVAMAFMWCRMAKVSAEKLQAGANGESSFYQSKLDVGAFFMARILPRHSAHFQSIMSGAETLTRMPAEAF